MPFPNKLTRSLIAPPFGTGQRLAAQKGQSDDIVGAMKAQEQAREGDSSDDED